MTRTLGTFVIAMLAFAIACPAQTRPARPGPYGGGGHGGGGYGGGIARADQSQNTASATFVISMPEGTRVDMSSLSSQLRTTSIDEVAKEFGIPKETILEGYSLQMVTVSGQLYGMPGFAIRVELPEGKVKAGDVLTSLAKRLRDAVAKQADEQRKSALAAADRDYAEAQMRVQELNERIEKLRAEVRARSGRFEVSSETLHAAVAKLDDEHQSLSLDREADSARIEALQSVVAQESRRAEDSVKTDAISTELQKVIEFRDQAMKMLEAQYKAGVATAHDLSKARADLADARVRLAERREALAGGASGQLGLWNRELQNLTITMRQKSARLRAIELALKKLQDALPLLDAISRVQDEIQLARADLTTAQKDLYTARKLMRSGPPTVTEQ